MGHTGQLPGPGSFFTGCMHGFGYIVCRDSSGQLRAFYNVRWTHHYSQLVLLSVLLSVASPVMYRCAGIMHTVLRQAPAAQTPGSAATMAGHTVPTQLQDLPLQDCSLFSPGCLHVHAGTDGALQKAHRLTGIENFDGTAMGLTPLAADTWGPLVFISQASRCSPAACMLRNLSKSTWVHKQSLRLGIHVLQAQPPSKVLESMLSRT